jgi:hypothetical protein
MVVLILLGSKTQEQVHCQHLHSIMKECSRKSILTKTTLHHEGKLTHASFPYSTSTSVLPMTTLHYEGNIVHASFPSWCNIVVGNALVLEGKLECFFYNIANKHCTMKKR